MSTPEGINDNLATGSPPKRAKHVWRWLICLFGLAILILITGYIWTLIVVRPDSNVTDEQRQALASRAISSESLSLDSVFKVKGRIVSIQGRDNFGQPVQAFTYELYTLFGKKLQTTDLSCWVARTGIDGVKQGDTEPLGTMSGSIWCDGIMF